MEDKLLIKIAMEAREKSYSPYSNFKVGAAVYTKSGKIFTGCNIESAAFTPTICAERVALSKSISEGYKDIEKIAVVGSDKKISFPCGVCRQFLREFGRDIKVICAKNIDQYEVHTLEELLPNSFGPEDLD
ncbi:Cytidine deaminase [bioreactor metagenome]|jgi:cytidine deaminase|uniref:Cytidine deaminase n=2 Tax=root TaxID=1 RepID=A0A562JGU6_9FIRM|nr:MULTISPECIES: cytidine deaminase [Sedimentibacter]MEA5094407.1 cytidine deaminase [Sedimentibacter saalensis]TWH82466.1 cytidine deaminase [Sedimentibacter saalensis]